MLIILICLVFLIAGISSILGLGGGVFYVPVFLYVGGLSIKEAVPLSLVIILGVSTISTINHYRAQRIAPKTGLILELFTLLGAISGTYVHTLLPEEILHVWFGLVLFLFGGWSLWQVSQVRKSEPSPKNLGSITDLSISRKMMVFVLAFLSGIFAGALGIGGGIIKVPLLVYTVGMPMTVAAGTSELMVLITSSGSGLIYYLKGQLKIDHAFIFLFSGMVGSYLGTHLSLNRLESQQLSKIFACVLVLVGFFMLIENNMLQSI